jgi:hypothetical protein
LCRDENDEYIGCEFAWLELEAEECEKRTCKDSLEVGERSEDDE